MQGPYSLNGYRVRVYRQDSATQWFTGIITHHDLFSRTMVVMNDQVLEPQNVDPSMVQMTFLDEVVYSLLKGENIGITSRRRSRSNQNSNASHSAATKQSPVQSQQPQMQQQQQMQQQRNARSCKRKGSDSSIPDEDKLKEEKCDFTGRGDFLKNKNKHSLNKKRKPENEKKLGLKRLRADDGSDYSVSSDSENSNKRIDSSSELNSETEVKNKSTSKASEEEGKSQSGEGAVEQKLTDGQSPRDKIQEDEKQHEQERLQAAASVLQEEKPPVHPADPPTLYEQNANVPDVQGYIVEKRSAVNLIPRGFWPAKPTTPKCVIDITDEGNSDRTVKENKQVTVCLQTSLQSDSRNSDSKNSLSETVAFEIKKDLDHPLKNNVKKMDFAQTEAMKNLQEGLIKNEKEKPYYGTVRPSITAVFHSEEVKKMNRQHPPSEPLNPKFNTSADISRSKSSASPDASKSKTNSSETLKPKMNFQSSQAAVVGWQVAKSEPEFPRSSFHPVRSADATKSPLLIDRNEPFTVYRDPALIGPPSETNRLSSYLHQHLHPLHVSSHTSCLTPSTHHAALSASPHLLGGPAAQPSLTAITAQHHSVHQSHHLSAVLSGVPAAPLISGHPRLDSVHASNLSHLALAHHQQQQLLQQQQPPHLLGQAHPASSYGQLELYSIMWPYPNGTHPYPGLSLSSSKWAHPENSVNAESCLRRNTASPWLHQPTPVTSADSLGLLSHIPVRPSSADPHRPLKLPAHSSPPLSKAAVEHHKEEVEKRGFIEPLHSARPSASLKADLEHSRTQTGKDSQLHRHFMDSPLSHSKQRSPQEPGDRLGKHKEENRRTLTDGIDVAHFGAKIKGTDVEKDSYSRIASLPVAKSVSQKTEKDTERTVSELYKIKQSVAQTLPQSNYFTTLSNSVLNEPPRSYPFKETTNPFAEKSPSNPSSTSNSSTVTSFRKPPPLIKHQPEGEGLMSKITEQLSQQVSSPSGSAKNDSRSPAAQVSVSPLNGLPVMPALHRAPVFHPPVHHSQERKDSNYASLSPPTLTPVQPMNASGKLPELQKPPTLVPELRELNTVHKAVSETSCPDIWKACDTVMPEKSGWHLEKSSLKPQSATASVIVRPPSTKFDTGQVKQLTSKSPSSERYLTVTNSVDSMKASEVRETGRVILANMTHDSSRVQFDKNSKPLLQESGEAPVTSPSSMFYSTESVVTTAAITTTSVTSQNSSDVISSALTTTNPAGAGTECPAPKTATPIVMGTQTSECKVSNNSMLMSTFHPVISKTGNVTQPLPGPPSTTDFFHLKKHKAALAAAQSRSTNAGDNDLVSSTDQKCPSSVSQENVTANSTITKVSTVSNGQASQASQPNFHTKLKKAWLTRHSEEDKHTNKTETPESTVSDIVKPCTATPLDSSTNDLGDNKDNNNQEEGTLKDDKVTGNAVKRAYESGSESDDSDGSESRSEQRTKRQPKPTYKKKQNDLQKRKGDTDKEEETVEVKPNGVLSRGLREKNKLKLQSSNGIPRSVLKDWRKVKKLKQTGESFLQDDSCSEIGPNLQKCRECRMVRNKKGEEPAHSPVFCRFYYFRRLSFSKNGVVRIDGFSSPDQYDDETLSLWAPDDYEDNELGVSYSRYILGNIGDKFCQLVMSERTALSWIKKDAKIAWKRAVRGVREMCDACEATLFNIHWVCQKCGFVVCLDCYKAKERKSSRDKELYVWMKCVKGQPHDHKHLMPTQIIPGTVLTDLVDMMHTLRDKFEITSHCPCTSKQNAQLAKLTTTNGVSQVLQNVLNHSNKISLCLPDAQKQTNPKPETNGNTSPASDTSTDSKLTPPESQSPLHWLADLAEQKSREEKKENKETPVGKQVKDEKDHLESPLSMNCKNSAPVSHGSESGSTLRDLLTTTAGKLRLGSTDAGIAFAPVYSTASHVGKGGRSMPNILDDIIASVVENKIPANRTSKPKLNAELPEDKKDFKKAVLNEGHKPHSDIPHAWLCDRCFLWLKDPKHIKNWKVFRECWKKGQPVLVSGQHREMNADLWKAEVISQEFGDHHADSINCKDGTISDTNIKEFWEGFEDITKRQKLKSGEHSVLKLKDWPSGEEFKTMMPSRYDDFIANLPLPEYTDPEGRLNLASHLPGFFVRPDLGPRICFAYGVAAAKDQDIGTLNLHLEVSDIISILLYVGIVKENGELNKPGDLKKLEEEDIDDHLKNRLKDSSEIPGALWHIYSARDADKIKDFLQKVAKEEGLEMPSEHDPLRDQSWYLNKKLRQRLLEDCGVKCVTALQFLGDSIILPAGTPYQIQNLHSCIQVTEDFVSPEHLNQSFHLTQELRPLREEINFDDKLQVKNILYHSVKEAVSALKIYEIEMEEMQES
ncbi:probable JmjC domain-containing histone demethylation protein 2C isoform X1 [Protopterus annectens]|uniref:probable JmjC domain-containing histone demethylation protein 2C isoform X1 n=1 Tax=Protopterus annectens TaxID=7888 RepID=UPI001CFB151C|nr:probable JmjC domain-containing histone demethylation protein 2C isoform X1 [Protopterus annectens]